MERYEIDTVLILNLDERVDRLWATYGALSSAGVPVAKIQRFPATSGSDFKDSDGLIHAATEDGFPQFSYLVKDLPADDPGYQFELNIKSQTWNYCQMLRYLKDTRQSAVILYDDRYIKNWESLVSLYGTLRHFSSTDNLILQLDYYFSAHFNQQMRRPKFHGIPFVRQGPASSSDNAMVYSPEGAEWFLSKILEPENEFKNVESTIARLSFLPRKERPNFLSCDIELSGTLPSMGTDIGDKTQRFEIPLVNKK